MTLILLALLAMVAIPLLPFLLELAFHLAFWGCAIALGLMLLHACS